MSMLCEGLNLLAIPHIGIYDTQGYQIFIPTPLKTSISSLPPLLTSQLSSLSHLNIEISQLTLYHNAKFLSGFQDFVDLNLIFHPYVFYDTSHGESHSCTLHMAVYQDDCEFSRSHLNNHTCDSAALNPENIFTCHLPIHVHPDKGSMCISPNNGRIKVSTYVPMHVFYTLVLVPYKGKIVKGMVAKHLLIIDRNRVRELQWVLEAHVNEEDLQENFQMMQRVGTHPGFVWYMHNVLWKLFGRPGESKFGEKKWNELKRQGWNGEKEMVLMMFSVFLGDLQIWMEGCRRCLDEVDVIDD